jgi:alkylation response protein AidB-like acyl-CoA dehydrogenase
MSEFYSKKDLYFQLFENLNCVQLTEIPFFGDHSEESFKLILDAAAQIAEKNLYPILAEMDRNEPILVDGKIKIHPKMKEIVEKFGEDGWINATFPYQEGGQQVPWTIHLAAGFILQAANYSASVFPFLTTGAANLIRSFGSQKLIETFTPLMYAGKWQGTMALTEPDAGSSLADLITTAYRTEDPTVYKIKGQKIYISCGDHDACENFIHLLLARIEGAPAGTKGISLFIVPQKRIENGESNDVLTQGIYHKMGYKGAPIAHLMLGSEDGCEGYLVGETNKGLSYMFQMMNEARLGVGMNAVAISTAAYTKSLAYAKERPQGRKISEKDLSKPQISIIQHADVKRMLLFQKSVAEGSLALVLYCAQLSDRLTHEKDEIVKNELENLLNLLTPIAKSYPAEMGILSTSAAVQILGGAGYTTDFAIEQYFRDARIHPIHEGTTGIQGLDLLGRKLLAQNGLGWKIWQKEIRNTLEVIATFPDLKDIQLEFEIQLQNISKATESLLNKSQQGPEVFLADATLFLEMAGILALGWIWMNQAIVSSKKLEEVDSERNFYLGKIETARYFAGYELVKIESISKRLLADFFPTLDMQEDWF